MRARILIVAALMAGVWAAARFKPTSENSRHLDNDATGRPGEVLRVNAPGSDDPVVSDLEARPTAELALVRPVERKTVAPRAPRRAGEAKPDPATLVAALVPEMRATTTSRAEAPLHLAQAPLPASPTPGEGRSGGDGADQPADGGRGPAIIIRGGGSARDPCALHGPRTRGPGIAINTTLPPLGGGVLVNDRAPRGRGGSARIGMSRGGIR